MTHTAIARCLLAALCAAQGAPTLAVDLNRTHARYHCCRRSCAASSRKGHRYELCSEVD
jgi:hypothetical protein